MSGAPPQDRIRTLLLRGDNLLKSGRPERLPRAIEAFEQAAELAGEPGVDPAVRELVERRLRTARSLRPEAPGSAECAGCGSP